jgi:hypothetical protein
MVLMGGHLAASNFLEGARTGVGREAPGPTARGRKLRSVVKGRQAGSGQEMHPGGDLPSTGAVRPLAVQGRVH